MKSRMLVAGLASLFLLASCATTKQALNADNNMLQRYKRAEEFLPVNLSVLAKNNWIEPHWNENGEFWYSQDIDGQTHYFYYHKDQGVQPLFEPARLAQRVGATDIEQFSNALQLQHSDGQSLVFTWQQQNWQCRLTAEYACTSGEEVSTTANPLISPDGKWQAYVKDYNLHLRDTQTGAEYPLTSDGSRDFAYATANSNPKRFMGKPPGSVSHETVVYWSDDSQYMVTFRLDLRNVGTLSLVQSVTGDGYRPRTYQYHYPLAGDKHIPQGHLVLVDLGKKQAIKVDTPSLLQTYYGDPVWGGFEQNNRFYFIERERGFRTFRLKELSPQTGEVRTLIEEHNPKYIDPWIQDYYIFPKQNRVFWTSERNGVQQVFSYELNTGRLLQQVTPDNMIVRDIKSFDMEGGRLFFEGATVAQDEPYFRNLYSVNLDGTQLKRLTVEPQMHYTQVSPDNELFIDTLSTVEQPAVHLLKSAKDGRTLATLAKADVTGLQDLGYKAPEPFSLLADDGVTRLFGILYFPTHFDPEKSYPVINDVYTGPHGYFTPKTYNQPLRAHANALAELGFIVFKMDGRGTAKRARRFHDVSYKNLGGGVDDHVWAIKQLAKTRPYMDINRVGIYGFSAGGYDTAHAMFTYPEFFKVGVSASGNHDFRIDKTGWNETWMGYPVDQHWDEQSNLSLAQNLQGKLLLAHGELDENVNPAATMQLVDRLIKANKDFEFMMYPNMGHVLHRHPYFVRSRWDFFVEHLLGETPPDAYQISSMEVPQR